MPQHESSTRTAAAEAAKIPACPRGDAALRALGEIVGQAGMTNVEESGERAGTLSSWPMALATANKRERRNRPIATAALVP